MLRTTLLLSILLAAPFAWADITATEAWIRETPPGRTVAAGYVELHNRAAAPSELTGARSPQASRVEIHETRQDDGMMRMRQVASATVPANGSLALEPGGMHLMLFDLAGAREGARVPVTLEFAGGGELTLEFEVRRARGGHGSAAAHQAASKGGRFRFTATFFSRAITGSP